MDRLGFDVVTTGSGARASTALGILVNGERLEALARVVELPYAEAEGNPGLAGSYAPLTSWDIDADPDHFLGRPVASWFDDGDTVLLGCECGEWGCWPLTADIHVSTSSVRWTNFRHGHREWDLGALGPFEFARSEYETALSALR